MAVCLGKSIMLSPFPVLDPMQTMACTTAVGGGLQLEPDAVFMRRGSPQAACPAQGRGQGEGARK
jgi:hypothetical protein